MDEIRRALILGIPTVGALGLAGCVQSDEQMASAEPSAADNERAFAQGLINNSTLAVTSATNSALGPNFNGKGNLGSAVFRPNLQLTAACLKNGNNRLALRLAETIARSDGSSVYRTLALTINSGTSFKLSPTVNLASSGAASGKMLIHGDTSDVSAQYLPTSGSIKVVNPIFSTFFYVQFNKVLLKQQGQSEVIALNGTLVVKYLSEEEPYPFS